MLEPFANKVASDLNIDKVYSELLPQDKVNKVEDCWKRNKKKKSSLVGNGINDAPVFGI